KGTLILRDIELLAEAAEVTEVGLNVSAGFVDKDLWRSIEPGTPAPGRRLEACAALNERGLRCGVLMGPVVPFLSDSPAQLAAAARASVPPGPRRRTDPRGPRNPSRNPENSPCRWPGSHGKLPRSPPPTRAPAPPSPRSSSPCSEHSPASPRQHLSGPRAGNAT